jgi:16S rRNA U516 pseudouridylate synthase RsuA-like enzyme
MATKPDPASRFARRSERPRSMAETMTPAAQPAEATRQLTARIPESLHREIRQYVAAHDITVQDLVRSAIVEAMRARRDDN